MRVTKEQILQVNHCISDLEFKLFESYCSANFDKNKGGGYAIYCRWINDTGDRKYHAIELNKYELAEITNPETMRERLIWHLEEFFPKRK